MFFETLSFSSAKSAETPGVALFHRSPRNLVDFQHILKTSQPQNEPHLISGVLGVTPIPPVSFQQYPLLQPAPDIGARAGCAEPVIGTGPSAAAALEQISKYLDSSSDKVVYALEILRKYTLGEKSFAKGTLGALRKPETLDLYLA